MSARRAILTIWALAGLALLGSFVAPHLAPEGFFGWHSYVPLSSRDATNDRFYMWYGIFFWPDAWRCAAAGLAVGGTVLTSQAAWLRRRTV